MEGICNLYSMSKYRKPTRSSTFNLKQVCFLYFQVYHLAQTIDLIGKKKNYQNFVIQMKGELFFFPLCFPL